MCVQGRSHKSLPTSCYLREEDGKCYKDGPSNATFEISRNVDTKYPHAERPSVEVDGLHQFFLAVLTLTAYIDRAKNLDPTSRAIKLKLI